MKNIKQAYLDHERQKNEEFIQAQLAAERQKQFNSDRMKVRLAFVIGWPAINELEHMGVEISGEISRAIGGSSTVSFKANGRQAHIVLHPSKQWTFDSSGWEMAADHYPAERLIFGVIERLDLCLAAS